MINVKAAKAAVSHYKAELADIKKVLRLIDKQRKEDEGK